MRTKTMAVYSIVVMLSFAYAENFRSYFGSMAINPQTGIPGTANNFGTKEEAINGALLVCNKKNSTKNSCKSVGYVSNGCAALAWSKSSRSWNGEIANDDMNVAAKQALEGCKRKGASDCQIVQAFCTKWETIESTSTTTWW